MAFSIMTNIIMKISISKITTMTFSIMNLSIAIKNATLSMTKTATLSFNYMQAVTFKPMIAECHSSSCL
jgi:hypothetical protein